VFGGIMVVILGSKCHLHVLFSKTRKETEKEKKRRRKKKERHKEVVNKVVDIAL